MSLPGFTRVLQLGWHHTKLQITRCVPASWWHPLIRAAQPLCEIPCIEVPAGSNLGFNRCTFFAENCVYLFDSAPCRGFFRTQCHSYQVRGESPAQAGGHEENLALSVNQNNQSRNVNALGLESKCQVSSQLFPSIFHVQPSSITSHKIEKSLSIIWRPIQSKWHLVLDQFQKDMCSGNNFFAARFWRGQRDYYWGVEKEIKFLLSKGKGCSSLFNRLIEVCLWNCAIELVSGFPLRREASCLLHMNLRIWLVLYRIRLSTGLGLLTFRNSGVCGFHS